MLLAFLAAAIIGVLFGIITGLTPGVHINLVSVMLLSAAPLLAQYIALPLLCLVIVSMSITHTFLDTIPSIFLGAPDDDKSLGVLPGHRYLLRGNGLMAVKLCIIGGILGTLAATLFFLPLLFLLEALNAISSRYFFWILLSIVAFTIYRDQKPLLAALIFLLSGILGLITFHLPLREPLLPLLSGMFGVSTLLYSINEQQNLPDQKEVPYTQLEWRKTWLGTTLGVVAGMLTALLPGISASAASSVSSQGSDLGDHGFLILLGALGSASFILSLAAYIAFEKARNGAMAVIVSLSDITPSFTLVLLSIALLSTGVAAWITLFLGRSAARWLPHIPYRATCIAVIAFVACIVLVRTSWLGLCVLITSTALGLLPAVCKTARAQAMGCLLLPVLTYIY